MQDAAEDRQAATQVGRLYDMHPSDGQAEL